MKSSGDLKALLPVDGQRVHFSVREIHFARFYSVWFTEASGVASMCILVPVYTLIQHLKCEIGHSKLPGLQNGDEPIYSVPYSVLGFKLMDE